MLIVDGCGTPGRGPQWEREVAFELADIALTDQIDALHAVAAERTELTLTRVGIRGWSYGGYVAALGVLRRPDIFKAAIAIAAVADWRLYNTYYTERFLGLPDERLDVYNANSLISDASKLAGELILVHGLADDNVFAAHTFKLSSALLAAGRPHTLLPISGSAHITTDEDIAENLLILQQEFLRKSLV